MRKLRQGEIVYVDLAPTKGVETTKKRPCVVVSNNSYNQLLNTVIVAPISSSPKYQLPQFTESPLFIPLLETDRVRGKILLQHLRSIDPNVRIQSPPVLQLDTDMIMNIQRALQNFF